MFLLAQPAPQAVQLGDFRAQAVKDATSKLQFHRPELRRARLAVAMGENDQRQDYLRAVCRAEGGELSVTPFARQDSSMLKTLADANCLAIRPPFAPPAEAGTPIDVLLLR